jgi:hypothetical protein
MRKSVLQSILAAQSLSLVLLASCGGSQPAPSQAPPEASAVEMLSTGKRSCEAAQRAGVPVRCQVAIIDGVPAVVMEFSSHDEAEKHAGTITKRVGAPFCDEAEGLKSHASAVIMAENQYRSFDCAKRQWSEWARSKDAGSGDGG